MIDSIFVVKKDSNDLIFNGQLSDHQIEDLETVLGQVVMKASSQSSGSRKLIALKQGKFLYGVFDAFYMILAMAKGTSKDVADKAMRKLGPQFMSKFSDQIAAYSGDNNVFASFSSNIQQVITALQAKSIT